MGVCEGKKGYITKSLNTGHFMQNAQQLTLPYPKVASKESSESPDGRNSRGSYLGTSDCSQSFWTPLHSSELFSQNYSFSLLTVFLTKGNGSCRCHICNIPAISTIIGNKYWDPQLCNKYFFKQCFLISHWEANNDDNKRMKKLVILTCERHMIITILVKNLR